MWLLKKIQHSASMALFLAYRSKDAVKKTKHGEVGCSSSHYHLRSAQFFHDGKWLSALARKAMSITSCPTASAIIFSSLALRYPSVMLPHSFVRKPHSLGTVHTKVYRINEFRRGGVCVAGSTTWLSKHFLTQPRG